MSELTDALIQRAISEAKKGNKETARKLLADVVKLEDNNINAWYLLSQMVDNDEKAIACLETVLKINPNNEHAKSRISRLLSSKQSHIVLLTTEKESQPTALNTEQKTKEVSVNSQSESPSKKCPYCAETIKAEAIVCRYCGRNLAVRTSSPHQKDLKTKKPSSPLAYILITAIFLFCLCAFAFLAISGADTSTQSSLSFNEAKAIRYVQDWIPKNNNSHGWTCKESYDTLVYFYRNNLAIYDARVEWSATKQDENIFIVSAKLKGETGWANYSWRIYLPSMKISTTDVMAICDQD